MDGHIYLDRLNIIDAQGRMLVLRRELEDLEPPVAPIGALAVSPTADPATAATRIIWRCDFWSGSPAGVCDCSSTSEVPERRGLHTPSLIGWANRNEELYEQEHGDGGFAQVAVAVNHYPYREGDTWYRDMRPPGFAGEQAPDPDNSVQWLAEQIVADPRFAEATVKFWWPALMGSEVAEPPGESGDADFEGLLLAANAQGAEVARLAEGFRSGFHGGPAYNLKDLLVEMVLSKWFRADGVEDADPVRQVALRGAGAKRLLTPEELARKTEALTGYWWGRKTTFSGRLSRRRYTHLTGDYRLLYGGIDSEGITERARDLTTVMAGIAKLHAVNVSCPVVLRELYLLPEGERRLFGGIDKEVSPVSEFSAGFEIEADSRATRETLSLGGELTAGSGTVRLTYHQPLLG